MLGKTLRLMARRGLYDQLAGGFFRYSVDRQWHIPHFEKMLYDNAQLIELYALASQVFGGTDGKRFAAIALNTASFLDVDICLVLDRSSSMKLSVSDTAGYMATSDPRFCQPPSLPAHMYCCSPTHKAMKKVGEANQFISKR